MFEWTVTDGSQLSTADTQSHLLAQLGISKERLVHGQIWLHVYRQRDSHEF